MENQKLEIDEGSLRVIITQLNLAKHAENTMTMFVRIEDCVGHIGELIERSKKGLTATMKCRLCAEPFAGDRHVCDQCLREFGNGKKTEMT